MELQRNDIDRPEGAAVVKLPGKVTALEVPLRCVWTSYPDHDRCCHERVPGRVAADAWQNALHRTGASSGFFHFSWQGQVWLGYGLPDGTVRGIYCPEHRAEREQRLGYDPELVIDPEPVVLTAAVAGRAG
jgi:hypothetical protein